MDLIDLNTGVVVRNASPAEAQRLAAFGFCVPAAVECDALLASLRAAAPAGDSPGDSPGQAEGRGRRVWFAPFDAARLARLRIEIR